MNQHSVQISSGSPAAVYICYVSAEAAVPGTSAATIAAALTAAVSFPASLWQLEVFQKCRLLHQMF